MTHILELIPGSHKVTMKKCTGVVRDTEYGNVTTRTFADTSEIVGMIVTMSAEDYSKLLEQDEGEHEYANLLLLVPIDVDIPANSIVLDNFFTGLIYEVVGISDKISHYYQPIKNTVNYSEYLLRKYTGSETFA